MITIKFDEKSVFTFEKETLSIHVHDHKDGKYEGDIREIGKIQFDNKDQAYHFMEMIALAIEIKLTQ